MMYRGADARVWIAGYYWAVQRYSFSGSVPPINVSNTEGIAGNPNYTTPAASVPSSAGGGFQSFIRDLGVARIRLVSATFDSTDNPWSNPPALDLGSYYTIQFYPDKDGSIYYDFPNCLLVDFTHEGTVPGPQPLTLEFTTDGDFHVYS